eukprot:6429086-Amphidinium_carterae.1
MERRENTRSASKLVRSLRESVRDDECCLSSSLPPRGVCFSMVCVSNAASPQGCSSRRFAPRS